MCFACSRDRHSPLPLGVRQVGMGSATTSGRPNALAVVLDAAASRLVDKRIDSPRVRLQSRFSCQIRKG